MKPIKMFGLAALVALMGMAFAGPSSAMAESTDLCDQDPGSGASEVCPLGHSFGHTHLVSLSGAKPKILTSFLTVECDYLFLGQVKIDVFGRVVLVGKLTQTNCGSCTVEEVGEETTIELVKLGHELADVTGESRVHVVCGASLDCTYDGKGLVGHALGPLLSTESNGEIRVEEKTLAKVAGGLLCPKTAKLDYLLTNLTATYITQ